MPVSQQALPPFALALSLALPGEVLGTTIFVSNEKGNSITVIDGDSLEVKATIPVGNRPRGIVLSKDNRYLYICASDEDHIEVLDTENMSLSLTALCWRAISEPLFDQLNPWGYSNEEKIVIYNTLYAIEQKASALRQEIFAMNLDPYLRRGRTMITFSPLGKGGPNPGEFENVVLNNDLDKERWGVGDVPDTREAAEAYMLSHPCGNYMNLMFSIVGNRVSIAEFILFSGGKVEVISSEIDYGNKGLFTFGPFDMIEPINTIELEFQINANIKTNEIWTGVSLL